MPPNSIEAIRERVRGALTGPCGERDLREHAFDDLEWLLEELGKNTQDQSEAVRSADAVADEANKRAELLEKDNAALRDRLKVAESDARRLLYLLSPPVPVVAS